MNETEIIALVIIISLLLGAFFFFLSGIFVVKENQCAVFEKMYKYYTHKGKGIYLFTPFITKRVGLYQIDKQYLKVNLKAKSIYIIYQIEDVKTYHYNKIDFKQDIYNLLLEKENEDVDLIKVINDFASSNGIKIISTK